MMIVPNAVKLGRSRKTVAIALGVEAIASTCLAAAIQYVSSGL